ncbi:MAG TPA: right-handed parallel beta-helix repeat-containing protein [Anaerolineales bacterium]|nr:right-handed parallel beta-helix repeat-containing protein [Anaerolineales bacterium]
MNIAIHRIAGLLLMLALILGNTIHAKAAGKVYYVSPSGKDTNPGTASAPFRTFAKANSVLTAGSTLNIYAGVYNQQLEITKSGTSIAWITVKPVGGNVVIDMQKAKTHGLDVRASYIHVTGLVVKNSNDVCVNLAGNNITVGGLSVYTCTSHGIQANDSFNIKILNSHVLYTVLSNAARVLPSGWGSAIKIRQSYNVLIQGNVVHNNYGEGIGSRGVYVTIRDNKVYNNYSVNIYTNSENALIERNFVYCTPHSGFERSGLPAVGIGLAEEYYPGWGARLKNARVLNNIVAFCRNGVRYMGADAGVIGGGLKNAIIAYNTLYGSTNAALSIVYESAQAGSLIANNIIWQAQNNLTAIDSPTGIKFQNNLWKVAPPVAFRSPGDRYGDPKFATTPGYTTASYRPSSASPAARAALHIGIGLDFYSQLRGPMFDMGAIQFFNPTVSTSTQVLSSPTATRTLPTSTVSSVPTLVQPTNTLPPATPENTASPVPPTSTSAPVTAMLSAPISSPASSPAAIQSFTVTAPTVQPSQETRYDNKHSAFVYSAGWLEEVSPYAIDGSFARTSTTDSLVTFQFTGQSFSVIYKGGPSYRTVDVYVDNVLIGTIDERLSTSTYKARWDYPGQLSPGQHILKLVFVASNSNTNGSIDAVIVR